MLRLFVGIDLPPAEKLRLSVLAGGLPGARWVDPGNYHVTLRFIGAVSEGAAEDIHEALMKISAPGFDLAISGLGMFTSGDRVHTLHAGVVRCPGLLHIHEKIETAMTRLGMPRDHRRYSPHVTLASCRADNPAAVQAYLATWAAFAMPPLAVTAFQLVVSTVTKAGSHYQTAATYPLTKAHPSSG